MLATSSLTAAEYLRFTVRCEAELMGPVAALVRSGCETVAGLTRECAAPWRGRLLVLLRALLYASALAVCDGPTAAAAAADVATDAGARRASQPRKRRRSGGGPSRG